MIDWYKKDTVPTRTVDAFTILGFNLFDAASIKTFWFSGAPYIVWGAFIYQDVCPCHFFGRMNFYQNPINFFY